MDKVCQRLRKWDTHHRTEDHGAFGENIRVCSEEMKLGGF